MRRPSETRRLSEASDNSMELNEDSDHFTAMNEHPVDDISLDFFYKPHTLTLLSSSVLWLLYSALTRLFSLCIACFRKINFVL